MIYLLFGFESRNNHNRLVPVFRLLVLYTFDFERPIVLVYLLFQFETSNNRLVLVFTFLVFYTFDFERIYRHGLSFVWF